MDRAWKTSVVAVDLRIGDAATFPSGTVVEGDSAQVVRNSSQMVVVEGMRAGLSRAICENGEWATFIRVAKADYVGRAKFRHLEDPDEHC